MTMTRWWKCDLQVATPAWRFKHDDQSHNLSTLDGMRAFADDYMRAVQAKGLDVIAIADHNTGEWIDVMVAAGNSAGIAVFPGCEITTGSGADGIHLLIIGDRNKTSQEFDRLLASPIGYSEDAHPRYHDVGGKREPGSCGHTVEQVLDGLPDSYLVIAPHVLNDNGLASGHTAKGDIRYKGLHHPRLLAIDPGDCSIADANSFNSKFRSRQLDNLPRIKSIAFVSTSDAYSLADLGKRFCWIRMEEPSLESLRQAFLDYEARIICDWDARLAEFPDRNPNHVRHAWISQLSMQNVLDGSTDKLVLDLHSALNVIIGGRGSGKSTAVAALRQLYAGYDTLPFSIRNEAQEFARTAFVQSTLTATHFVAASQEVQTVQWAGQRGIDAGAIDADQIPTAFRIRVVSQKELYARVTADPGDPSASSRSLLAFVDESLGLRREEKALPGSWSRQWVDAVTHWSTVAIGNQRLKEDLSQLPAVKAAISTLQKQAESFDSDDARTRRELFERLALEETRVSGQREEIQGLIGAIELILVDSGIRLLQPPQSASLSEVLEQLSQIEATFRGTILKAISDAKQRIESWETQTANSTWRAEATRCAADKAAYLQELEGLGLRPEAYLEIRRQLTEQQSRQASLNAKSASISESNEAAAGAWQAVIACAAARRERRQELFSSVGARSQRLRFAVRAFADKTGWVNAIRDLLNLRTDAFLDDVPDLAAWLFETTHQVARMTEWRDGLLSGDLSGIASAEKADMRPTWQKRLEGLDEAIRLRLASEFADDVVEMSFLMDGGDPGNDSHWRPITRGSPGQRTAAMLAFVLHHGDEPLVLDQPEDDLDTEWLTTLVIQELRASRSRRQLIVVTHNANVPVNGDAERILVLENAEGRLQVRTSTTNGIQRLHCGAIENFDVRSDVQKIMEGGIAAFQKREQRYNLEPVLG